MLKNVPQKKRGKKVIYFKVVQRIGKKSYCTGFMVKK